MFPYLLIKLHPCKKPSGKKKHISKRGNGRSQTANFCTNFRASVSQHELVQSETSSGSIIKSDVCSVWALRLIVISFSLADSQGVAE